MRLLVIILTMILTAKLCSAQPQKPNQTLYDSALKLNKVSNKKAYLFTDSLIQANQSDLFWLTRFNYLKAYLFAINYRYDSAWYYLKHAELVNDRQKKPCCLGDISLLKGILYKDVRTDSSKHHIKKAYGYFIVKNDTIGAVRSLFSMSFQFMKQGDYLSAMNILKTCEEELATDTTSSTFHTLLINIGHVYYVLGLHHQALKNYKRTLNSGDQEVLEISYLSLMDIYLNLNKYDSAFYYNSKLKLLYQQYPGLGPSDLSFIDEGNVLNALGHYEEAIEAFEKSHAMGPGAYHKFLMLMGLYNAYKALGQIEGAKQVAMEATALKVNQDNISIRKSMYIEKGLWEFYDFLGNTEKAYMSHVSYFEKYEKLYNQQMIAQVLKFDWEKQLQAEKEKAALQKELLESQITRERQQTYFLIAIAVLLLVILVLVIIRYRAHKRMATVLESRVQERTKELYSKNRQLEEYAFINAHKLRAPVARLLGLTHLANHIEDQKELKSFFVKIKEESEDLDGVVKSITEAIDEGTVFDRDQVR